MSELKQLLDEVVERGYPELLGYIIEVGYVESSDALAEYGELNGGIYIDVDKEVELGDGTIKMGALASELSHIVRDVKLPFFSRFADDILYRISRRYGVWVERNTDLTTIRRGLGRELYAFMKFAEERGYPYDEERGLSLSELRVLLKID